MTRTKLTMFLLSVTMFMLACLAPAVAPGIVADDAAENVRRREYPVVPTPAPIEWTGQKRLP